MTEPILDLSEIVGLYKEDARKSVASMRAAAQRWEDILAGGPAFLELRKLAHQLRGSGRTYGFREVTRLGKALEHLMIKLQNKRIKGSDRLRTLVASYIDRLGKAFNE
jgi:chemotaxis protein histidine kinase CheA